ncbi:DUF1499 domain-containing protein [Erythrobacter rubeus]|uniref:DUF1499 domain-containing protein n=1 Tax=Erythrobacter rubeus TaxID=2760803 RepID=A0ABR8KL51_9SPHN|nr:DUF1499 domain-containing protein [Erythrobacter rubeus]MBD2841089.1 DUF1499 domain-containing protein [Erythrobacter rubeus]
MKNLSLNKLVAVLIVILPLYFMIAALGTKFGLWSWQFSLGTLIRDGGPILLGLTALISLIALILAVVKKPRKGWLLPAAGIAIPAAVFAMLATTGSTAEANPIHDVATDTSNPPQFSASTMEARAASEANPLSDYQTPLGELDMYTGAAPELAIKSHAQIINETYADLSPLPLGGASRADAIAAVAAAMGNLGFADIRTDAEAGRVEGVAETFWFGFKDDVVARIGENEIDFRSVSRVGRSDLGANAARIAELRERVSSQIGQR